MQKTVSFLTLGCAKNEADSASMVESLLCAGYVVVELGKPCDAIVVNTCSFIQSSIEESIDAIFEVAGIDEVQRGTTKLVVSGCLPSRFGESLEEELTEADAFVACHEEDDIVAIMDALLGVESPHPYVDMAFSYNVSEYLKISEGCSRHCSFCTIPAIRGPYVSCTMDEILADAASKVEGGAKELVLIAQDSGLWGHDLTPRMNLAGLLDTLASTWPEVWFRVMYLQPTGLTHELLAVMRAHANICNYFDIPLQHSSPEILRSMNRSGSGPEMLATIAQVRKELPDVALRTTLIVGYPGETEEQFEELCNFVEEAEFDYVGIFAYSPEEGTPAAELPDQVDEETKQERLACLRDIADAVSSAHISRHVGKSLDVLVLGYEEDGQLYGRAQCQAPDVDGVVYLSTGVPGSVVPVEIADTLLYEMEAKQ